MPHTSDIANDHQGAEGRSIRLRGVRTHNLKNVDLDLPLGKLIVFTGLSGSGKSSLAFDTLYAEGRRRYVETFSAHARMFLDRLDRPDADKIEGIPPAIAVGQRVVKRSSRGTVGTVTEVHEALALLYARVGRLICRTCRIPVEPAGPSGVAAAVEQFPEGTRYLIAFPVEIRKETDRAALAKAYRDDGFARVRVDGVIHRLDAGEIPLPSNGTAEIVIDRLVKGSETESRKVGSIETAFAKGLGRCRLIPESADLPPLDFLQGRRCVRCGTDYPEPDTRLFRHTGPMGACPDCEGTGLIVALDLSQVVPDGSKTLRDGAVPRWTGAGYDAYLEKLTSRGPELGIPVDIPFRDLDEAARARLIEGGEGLPGLREMLRKLEAKASRPEIRDYLGRRRTLKTCPACAGARLRPESLAYEVSGLNIAQLSALSIAEAVPFVERVATEAGPFARRALDGVRTKLAYLERIGLGYLTLNRSAGTLSDGEARRVALTTALGSGLVNTLYVLDEPSVGLHPSDVGRLTETLTRLRDAGNTVAVVEHEEAVMRSADQLVEIGPGAGESGGVVVFQGSPALIERAEGSPTGDFLSGRKRVPVPQSRREPTGSIKLEGATGNNLKGIDLELPLGVFVVVTGVSGSGKSSLINKTLHPALLRELKGETVESLPYRSLSGASALKEVRLVDSSPIGRSSRSNPITYLGAFDEIRRTFAATHDAQSRGYKPGTFSFNVAGGRCETCEGSGVRVVEMQFLADVVMTCPECRGRRYRPEVLEVTYRGKTIAEVFDLTAREAFGFFKNRPKIQARLRSLLDVGLEYLRLGQPASTLSGGEAQRLKLAEFLATSPSAITRQAASTTKTLFLLDEPTNGLHPADTLKLLEALSSLLVMGHSVVVIEHNPDVMLSADRIIDLGPGPGDAGGMIVAQGTPEQVAASGTPTGLVLRRLLS